MKAEVVFNSYHSIYIFKVLKQQNNAILLIITALIWAVLIESSEQDTAKFVELLLTFGYDWGLISWGT